MSFVGKTMENVHNPIKMGLVFDQNKYTKLVNKTTLKNVEKTKLLVSYMLINYYL